MPATWFKCEPIGFLSAFERIGNLDQAMVYTVICLRIYLDDGPVPNRPDAYVAQCNLGRTRVRRAIDALLEQERLVLIDGSLMNPRAADEIGERREKAASKSHPGKSGRKPRNRAETSEKPARNERAIGVGRANHAESSEVSGEEMAENSHSAQSNDFHARARSDQRREETPLPPNSAEPFRRRLRPTPLPDRSSPDLVEDDLDAESVVAMVTTGKRDVETGIVDDETCQRVVSHIMQLANMVMPPADLVLAKSWLMLGCNPEIDIFPHVARLCGSSRGPIRGFRYFDREVREQFAAKSASENANIADFARIARRARENAAPRRIGGGNG